jgi:predicted dehydrogenase
MLTGPFSLTPPASSSPAPDAAPRIQAPAPAGISRRKFLVTTGLVAGGLTILPSGMLRGGGTTNKLNIAIIGSHGRASFLYDTLKNENVVALCDVNADNLALAAKEFPEAKTYVDWRKCLEQKDLDAVVCCTPDSTHAFVAIWAMNRGLHVYMEKPLGNCVMEARAVRETYLKNRDKVATQHGTQRHAIPNCQRIAELVKGGAIGALRDVHAWGNRKHNASAYLPADGPAPSSIDYDLWTGPSPMHPFNPSYFTGQPQTNCLNWNMFRDFGSWQVGDMGAHVVDFVWNAIDADRPTDISAEGDEFNPAVAPSKLRAIFTLPANDWRKQIRMVWHGGGSMPNNPVDFLDLTKIGHGMMFVGSRGILVADFGNRMIIPTGPNADMTYFKTPATEDVAPPIENFMNQWINACKGDLKTSCDFDYAGRMVETLMLGLVAHEAGTKLHYDAGAGRITNVAGANFTPYFQREYRKGWTLNA